MNVQRKKGSVLDPSDTYWLSDHCRVGVLCRLQYLIGLVFSWDLLLAFDADIWGWWTQNVIFLCSLNSSLLIQPLLCWRILATSSSRFLVLSLCSTKAGSDHMRTKRSLGDHLLPMAFFLILYHNSSSHGDTRSFEEQLFSKRPERRAGQELLVLN